MMCRNSARMCEKNSDKLYNELKYILQEHPKGMKFAQLLETYKRFYGKVLDITEYGCKSHHELHLKFPGLFNTKMNRCIVIGDNYTTNSQEGLLFHPTRLLSPHVPVKKGESIAVEINCVYDPSKFWVVVKYRELAVFMTLIRQFYMKEVNVIAVPENMVCKELMCIAKIDRIYYRAVVINLHNELNDVAQVFLLDFGRNAKLSIKDLLYIPKKFSNVPRFSIRASMAYICPIDSRAMWSAENMNAFNQLISRKRLFARICEVDTSRKIVYVGLRELCGHQCDYINNIMVQNGIAQYSSEKTPTDDKPIRVTSKYVSAVKYLFLFPPFEMLECGRAPNSVMEFDSIKHCVPLDFLYKPYFKYDRLA